MIVRCNDDERHLFDSSEVHAFMKRSGLHPAFAERRSSRLIANQWREDVALLQKQSAGHANRFLPTADVDATRDQTAAIETYELFFERAREQHPTKCFEKALMWRVFFCF